MTTLHSSVSLVSKRWLSSAPAILALALAVIACGPADERPPPPTSVDTEASTSDLTEEDDDDNGDRRAQQRCEEGDARECVIKLPKQGSVQGCVDGVRYCENGFWGKCVVE